MKISTPPQLMAIMMMALVCLHSTSVASADTSTQAESASASATTAVDNVDLATGIRQYLTLMSTSMTKGLGYSTESNVNTFNAAPTSLAKVPNRIDANSKEGEEALKQLDLQSIYADNELGEKNLMWSLRGSSSEETLRKNLESKADEEVPAPINFRRLTEIAEGWVARTINAAYSYDGSDNNSQGSFHNMSPGVRKTAHQTSIYFNNH